MFSYQSTDGKLREGLDAPYDELSSASVGLFSFSELTTTEEDAIFGDQCVKYDDWQGAGQNVYFSVAQISAIAAPVLGFLAWIQVFFDMIYCRLCGSFVLISLLFFTASALQSCTFLVFADSEFCLEVESLNSCTLQTGAWYSLGAAVAYLVLSVLAPIVPISRHEERRGCCIVQGKPKKGDLSASKSMTAGGETNTQNGEVQGGNREEAKESETKDGDVEANNSYDSAPGETTDDDEKTTNTNNEGNTTVAEDDATTEDKSGLCSGGFFDNICGKNEQGTEVQQEKNDGN